MTDVLWEGAEHLRDWLVPVADLERYPGNPRRGRVADIAASLRRWGQLRPLLTDGRRIVAGNHTYLAAIENGWTHVAAIPNAFADEGEARAYLLADNRIPELGDYDQTELLAMLEELEQSGRWDGTGYDLDDLEDLRAAHEGIPVMEPAAFEGGFAIDAEALEARAAALAAGEPLREVLLTFVGDQGNEFGTFIKILRKELGSDHGVTELVETAVAEQAARLTE